MKSVLALVLASSMMLSGCSAMSAVSGLLGGTPDITAQAGATNNKTGLGVTSSADSSSSAESTIKDSTVGTVDSSSAKKTTDSSIKAETVSSEKVDTVTGLKNKDNSIKANSITADKIEITNNEYNISWLLIAAMIALFSGVGYYIYRKMKS